MGQDTRDIAEGAGIPLAPDEVRPYEAALDQLDRALEALPRNPTDEPEGLPWTRPSGAENPLNAVITAFSRRERAEGPLRRRTVGLKDHVSVAGVPLTLGLPAMGGFVPRRDATVVRRLLEAGAELTAKLNMDPFSHGAHGIGTGYGPFGRVENPWKKGHLSGGSSSGAGAAVATGLVDLAVGGDQGGSIRVPAAWCGVVGLKPTFGLVAHTGIVGVETTIDHAGPMARTAEDAARMLRVLGGPDGEDPRQGDVPSDWAGGLDDIDGGVRGLRIGLLREGFDDPEAESDVEAAVLAAVDALRAAGAAVRDVSVPAHREAAGYLNALVFTGTYLLAGGLKASEDPDLAWALARLLAASPHELPPRVKLAVLYGRSRGVRLLAAHREARAARPRFIGAYDAAFQDVDCLIMPTVPVKAPPFTPPRSEGEMLSRTLVRAHTRVFVVNTAPFNLTGHPAVSVPCGVRDGLPVGLQIVAPRFRDGLVLRLARAVERAGLQSS